MPRYQENGADDDVDDDQEVRRETIERKKKMTKVPTSEDHGAAEAVDEDDLDEDDIDDEIVENKQRQHSQGGYF